MSATEIELKAIAAQAVASVHRASQDNPDCLALGLSTLALAAHRELSAMFGQDWANELYGHIINPPTE